MNGQPTTAWPENTASCMKGASPVTHAAGICVQSLPIVRTLLWTAVLLLMLHGLVVASYLGDWSLPGDRRFFFDEEGNVPTFFSTLILLIASALLALTGAVERASRSAFATHWSVLALVFLGLAMDEAASFHEMLIDPMRQAFGLDGVLRFPWVLAGGAFAALVLALYMRFLAHLDAQTRTGFLCAGALYVGGAIGCEMLGGMFFTDHAFRSPPYLVFMTLEEILEMSGIIVFIAVLLRHLRSRSPRIELRLD